MQLVIGNRNSETRAEHLQLVFVQFFLLVRDVLTFAGLAESVTLDGLGQDNGGLAGMIDRFTECGMNLNRIVTAKTQARKLVVRKMFDHLQQAGISAEQVLPEIGAALDEIFLVLTVADFAQPPDQQAIAIVLNEAVPIGAPDAFDDIPSGSAEYGFQFLNDLAIAAHRAIEPLQVAVDHEN